MNALNELFEKKGRNIFSVYFTAGYPSINSTAEILTALEKQGVDLVEIGMPFSDPLADGPVIQESSRIALENGMCIQKLFDQLKKYHRMKAGLPAPNSELPTVLMGYLNPVMQFGMEKFLQECNACGVSGVILPDLPVEVYEEEYQELFTRYGIHFIFLVTPRTSEERLKKIASLSKGFVYLVSTAATTGRSTGFSADQMEGMKRVREIISDKPILTGFGIHDLETREAASKYSNGVVVGTAFIRELEQCSSVNEAVSELKMKLNKQMNVTA